MPTVYVLRSLRNGRLYVGYTERGLEDRLQEHNASKTASIKQMLPFEFVYSEHAETMILARQRERFFKSGHGRRTLKNLIANSQPNLVI